jgi:GNAT superfamily N-acetyltransferase
VEALLIRQAESNDIDWILGQLREFSKFIETKYELYGEEQYSKDGLQMLISSHLFLIAEKNSKRVGFVAGYLTPHLFNPTIKILNELFFWVIPEHRGEGIGTILMNDYIDFGKKNAQWITFSFNRFTKVNEKSLLKRGFHLHESTYLQEI